MASKVAMKKKMQQTQKNSEGGNKKLCLSLFPQEDSPKPLPKLLKPYLRSHLTHSRFKSLTTFQVVCRGDSQAVQKLSLQQAETRS